jgi:hypothetical protein
MALFRLISNDREGTNQPPGWYVERYTADGQAEIVSPLFLKRWQAQAEVERLSAKEPEPDA